MAVTHERIALFLYRLADRLCAGQGLQQALEMDLDAACVGRGRAARALAEGQGADEAVTFFPLSKGEKPLLATSFRYAFPELVLERLAELYRARGLRLKRILAAYVYPLGVLCLGLAIHATQRAIFCQRSVEEAALWASGMIGGVVVGALVLGSVLRSRFLGLSELMLALPFGREFRVWRRRRFLWSLSACLEAGSSLDEALRCAALSDGRLSVERDAERVLRAVSNGDPLGQALGNLGRLTEGLCGVSSARELASEAKRRLLLVLGEEESPQVGSRKVGRVMALAVVSPAVGWVFWQIVQSTSEQLANPQLLWNMNLMN